MALLPGAPNPVLIFAVPQSTTAALKTTECGRESSAASTTRRESGVAEAEEDARRASFNELNQAVTLLTTQRLKRPL
jgi:hypothetical protein